MKRIILSKLNIILTVLGLIFALLALYYSPWIQNIRSVKAWKIDRMANEYSKDSDEYKRLKAIAEAVRKGENKYEYTPSRNPGISP